MNFIERRRHKQEIKKKITYKKTIRKMRDFVSKLDSQKENYIKMATEAKKSNSDHQLKMAINGLKIALSYQQKAKEMLLNFEITMQLRDLSLISSEFLSGMATVSKEMSKIISRQDYTRVGNSFEKAMEKVENQNLENEAFLEKTGTSFESLAPEPDKISNDEIDDLINNRASDDIENKENELNKKLVQIEKILNDL